jgi:DNA invertase Pin-like site-specific DNA recombinase
LIEADDLENLKMSQPQPRIIWYVEPEMKRAHRDLVKAGMERARKQGKRIGRPRVTEQPEFMQQFLAIKERLNLGELSRKQAAKELTIGCATVTRFLDSSPLSPVISNCIND